MKRTVGTLWEIIAMHGFIVLLSLAAIPHSAWSINSVFGGPEPLPMYSSDWWGWYMPGLLMSITIDVGLLAFVMRLQKGERQGSLIVGYLSLCGLMAFGQFVYVASHIANFTLAAGVADYYHDLANGIIKAALFVYPAALPAVSAIYAFSVRQKPPPLAPEQSISVDTRLPQTAVKFADVGDLEIAKLPPTESVALPALEPVNTAETEAVDLPTPEPAETHALIASKREYSVRTSQYHCAHCGVAFTPKRANQKYHNDSCRTLAYNQRKARAAS